MSPVAGTGQALEKYPEDKLHEWSEKY